MCVCVYAFFHQEGAVETSSCQTCKQSSPCRYGNDKPFGHFPVPFLRALFVSGVVLLHPLALAVSIALTSPLRLCALQDSASSSPSVGPCSPPMLPLVHQVFRHCESIAHSLLYVLWQCPPHVHTAQHSWDTSFPGAPGCCVCLSRAVSVCMHMRSRLLGNVHVLIVRTYIRPRGRSVHWRTCHCEEAGHVPWSSGQNQDHDA